MRLLLPLAALLALTPFASAQNEVYSVYATQAELDEGLAALDAVLAAMTTETT